MLIGDVARRSGVSARMLRHYESLGLLRPDGRTGAGYREYTEGDLARILHIEGLRSLGLSLREVGRAMDDPGFVPSELVESLLRRTRDRIAAETELLTRLERIRASGPAEWDDVLRTVALLRSLGSERPDDRLRAALSVSDSDAGSAGALTEAVLAEQEPNVAGALRWALARSGDGGLAALATALDADNPAVAGRAVEALAALPDGIADDPLRQALHHDEADIRRRAALALGSRGGPAVVGILVGMVLDGIDDVDAADVLAALAADPGIAGKVTTAFEHAIPAGDSTVKRRIAQALTEIPGHAADRILNGLAADDDHGVAVTAGYALRLRAGSG
ncbi:MerR family transcriptional regulator [Nakamurella sp. YIM 132087]|uniref:MerR family transcriptional regulator n=1 Tax=Nakamurella alba TaxID=2665158 RepID=A0A7K1FJH1_9ACTN|nr:MerR family transcriptional regulator [Nakamurella alba]MTD13403.1 MerR family transcriptional regulator [Nakamurella alba]